MFIDSKKFDYGKFAYPNSDKLIERDKQFLKKVYLKWMKDNVNEIVARQWEIDDIGVVEQTGDFIKLLKEAEFTYSLGAYTSAISLVGICAEDLCRFFAATAGHSFDSLSQFDRINRLVSLGAFGQAVANKFHVIRHLRNDCLHFNQGFKQKDQLTLKANALQALNTIKLIYGSILGVVDYKTVESFKLLEIMQKISEEAASSDPSNLGIDEAIIRTRNVFANAFGVDISMNNAGRPVFKTSIYRVDDIDEDGDPFELTLLDMSCGIVVFVDLFKADIEKIIMETINKGSIVAATLMSVSNDLDMTAEWRLVGSVKKIG